jgi:hypothetical protein
VSTVVPEADRLMWATSGSARSISVTTETLRVLSSKPFLDSSLYPMAAVNSARVTEGSRES